MSGVHVGQEGPLEDVVGVAPKPLEEVIFYGFTSVLKCSMDRFLMFHILWKYFTSELPPHPQKSLQNRARLRRLKFNHTIADLFK